MSKRTKARGRVTRAGRTQKVSISLDRADLVALRRRAEKLYEGNLSAAIAEGARRIREEEGREALLTWLGDAAASTAGERAAIRAEWGHERPRGRRRRAA